MYNTLVMPHAQVFFFTRLLSLMIAPGIITIVSSVEPDVGAFVGFLSGFLLASFSPIFALPVVLLGVALNNLTFIFGLHFGWIIIAGCALGSVVYAFIRRAEVNIDFSMFVIIFTFMLLELGGGFFRGDGRLDRLFALVAILSFLALLAGSRPDIVLSRYFRVDASRALIYVVGGVGIIIVLNILSMLSSQEFRMARAGELGLSIGETESSPRSLSNILGVVVVACFSAAMSLPCKRLDRIAWILIGLSAFLGLFYTGSRMPAISVAFGLSIAMLMQFIFIGRYLKVATLLWVFSSLVFIAMFAKMMASLGPNILPFIDSTVMDFRLFRGVPDIESNIRLRMWASHFSDINAAQLVFGSGIGAMGNPHSLYIGALGAFGLIGLLLLVSFIIYLFIQALAVRSTVAIAVLAYVSLALTSSSDIDKAYFWSMISVVMIVVRLASAKSTAG